MTIEHGEEAEVYALKKSWKYRHGSDTVYNTDYVTASKAAAHSVYAEWMRNLDGFVAVKVQLFQALSCPVPPKVRWVCLLQYVKGDL